MVYESSVLLNIAAETKQILLQNYATWNVAFFAQQDCDPNLRFRRRRVLKEKKFDFRAFTKVFDECRKFGGKSAEEVRVTEKSLCRKNATLTGMEKLTDHYQNGREPYILLWPIPNSTKISQTALCQQKTINFGLLSVFLKAEHKILAACGTFLDLSTFNENCSWFVTFYLSRIGRFFDNTSLGHPLHICSFVISRKSVSGQFNE